jgi:hypothetical protein
MEQGIFTLELDEPRPLYAPTWLSSKAAFTQLFSIYA